MIRVDMEAENVLLGHRLNCIREQLDELKDNIKVYKENTALIKQTVADFWEEKRLYDLLVQSYML